MTPEALELVPTTDLIDTLMLRFDHAVFSGVNAKPTEASPYTMTRIRHYTGHQIMCVGLCQGLASYVQAISDENEEQIPKDEL